jgi:hypothetical protein
MSFLKYAADYSLYSTGSLRLVDAKKTKMGLSAEMHYFVVLLHYHIQSRDHLFMIGSLVYCEAAVKHVGLKNAMFFANM